MQSTADETTGEREIPEDVAAAWATVLLVALYSTDRTEFGPRNLKRMIATVRFGNRNGVGGGLPAGLGRRALVETVFPLAEGLCSP